MKRNKGNTKEQQRRYRAKYPEKIKEYSKKYRSKAREYDKARNNDKKRKRRADLKRATPKWLTSAHKKEIQHMRDIAFIHGLVTDHICPLNGENVCGLHVPWNIQIISKKENSEKGNRWDP